MSAEHLIATYDGNPRDGTMSWLLRGRQRSTSMPTGMDHRVGDRPSRSGDLTAEMSAILIEQPRHGIKRRGTGSKSFAGFDRASSLADLAYVAISGLTSRVTRSGSVTSLANIGDVFSDYPGSESPAYISPAYIEGHLSRPLVESVCVVLLSSLMYGYNCGNMNTSAPSIRAVLSIPSEAWTPEGESVPQRNNDRMWAFVVSIFCLGALLGCNSSAQLADRWGRKTFLLWTTAIFVLGGLLEASSALPDCALTGGWQPCTSRVGLLTMGRILSGIASGGVCVVAPTYLGEIAPLTLTLTLTLALALP